MLIVVASGAAWASLVPSGVGVDRFVVIVLPLERRESRMAIREAAWAV